jgi:hypothetical protein
MDEEWRWCGEKPMVSLTVRSLKPWFFPFFPTIHDGWKVPRSVAENNGG